MMFIFPWDFLEWSVFEMKRPLSFSTTMYVPEIVVVYT